MLSRSHPLVRRLRALRRDRGRREAEGVFVAEGEHATLEALASGADVELVVVTPRLGSGDEGRRLLARLEAKGVAIHEVAPETMDALQDARAPQPVLAVIRLAETDLDAVLHGRAGPPLLVVACALQDPGNLGSVVRTAEAAGATGLVATAGGADLHHPRTVRAAAGSIFRLPVIEADAETAISRASRAGLAILGAVPRGGTSYDAVDWRPPCAVVLGGEGGGIPAEVSARLDREIGIPMAPGVESLSVGAAAAVILFEAARARRKGTATIRHP